MQTGVLQFYTYPRAAFISPHQPKLHTIALVQFIMSPATGFLKAERAERAEREKKRKNKVRKKNG